MSLTLERLEVIIDAQTKPMREQLAKLQSEVSKQTAGIEKQTGRIKKAFSSVGKFIAATAVVRGLYSIGKSSFQMARSVEASIQQVNRLMGENAQAFMRWGKKNALTLNMSRSDFIKYGSVYGNLLSSFINSTSGVASQTTNLLKASSIIASATGRSMEDVMERIRSGLLGNTEAIEDLGIYVNVAMLESTDAFKKFAGDKSWNQLDFQTQQQIRLFAILEQTSKKFGDSVQNNTNSQLAQLAAIIKDIALNIGNILLPVLNAVLPPIIKVANAIRVATDYLATFMSLLFGKLFKTSGKKNTGFESIEDDSKKAMNGIGGINDALGKTGQKAKKTAKEIKGSLAGFDELNILQAPSSGGNNNANVGGAFGGGFGNNGEWGSASEEPDTSGISKAVDKAIGYIDKFKKYVSKNIPLITSILSGLGAGFITFKLLKNMGGLLTSLNKIKDEFLFLGLCVSTFFNEMLAGNGIIAAFSTLFGSTLGPILAISAGIAAVTSALVYLYQTNEKFKKLIDEAVSAIVGILKNLYNNVLKPLFSLINNAFQTVVIPLATFIATVFVKAVEAIATVALSFWKEILAPFVDFLVDLLAIALQGVIGIWEAWKPIIKGIGDSVKWIWDNVLSPFVDYIVGTFCDGFKKWGDLIDKLVPDIELILKGFVDFMVGVFTNDMNKAWEGITEIFKGFDNFLTKVFTHDWTEQFGILGTVLNKFFSIASSVWTNVKKLFNGIITFVSGVFTGNWRKAWEGVKSIFKTIFDSLVGIAKAPINGVIGIINSAIKGINRVGFDVPDWVPKIGGKSFRINIPRIPLLAQGGIANRATLGIFGEAGTEAILPLKRNTRGIEMIANKLLEHMPVQSESGGTYIIQLVLEDGTVLAKKIIKNIKDYEAVTGKPAFG